jgi:hypothetical protein
VSLLRCCSSQDGDTSSWLTAAGIWDGLNVTKQQERHLWFSCGAVADWGEIVRYWRQAITWPTSKGDEKHGGF